MPRSESADKPCAFSHELPYDHIDTFISSVGMRVLVRYKGETTLSGLELKRFSQTQKDFLGHSGVHDGYIDFSKKNRVSSFLSLAHLLYANVTVPKSFNQAPDVEKHQSIVSKKEVHNILFFVISPATRHYYHHRIDYHDTL